MEIFRRGVNELHNRRALGHVHAVVIALDLSFDPGVVALAVDIQHVARCRVLEAAFHMLGLSIQFVLAVTARFAAEYDLIGHDIHRHAAFDHTDVGRGFMIDAPQEHSRDPFGSDFNCVDAFFRADSGVRFKSIDAKFHAIGRWRFGKQKADGVAIEHETGARPQAAHVETFGADQTCLFADRENHIDGAAWYAVFFDHAQDFANDRNPALVIAAENRAPVGA